MFDVLDPPHDPAPTLEQHRAVVRAGRARVLRRRLVGLGSTAGVVFFLAVALVARGPHGGSTVAVVGTESPSTTEAPAPEPSTTTTTTLPPPTTTTTRPPVTTTTTTTLPPRVEPQASLDGYPAAPAKPGIVLTLRLDRTTVRVGEKFGALFTIENRTSEEFRYNGHTCRSHHHALYNRGEWVGGGPGRICTTVDMPPIVIPSGGSRQWALEFHTHAGEGGSSSRPLPPGVYQAAAGIHYDNEWTEPNVAWFAPAVDIEIK